MVSLSAGPPPSAPEEEKVLFLDIETSSTVDIKEGLERYAEHGKILCACVADLHCEPVSCTEDGELADILRRYVKEGGYRLVAHNAAFEYELITWLWRGSASVIPLWKWRDTMILARSLNLPGGLDALYKHLYPNRQGKLEEGAAMVRGSMDLLTDLDEIIRYCKHDVKMTREVWYWVERLTSKVGAAIDHALCPVDLWINFTGLPIDYRACVEAVGEIRKERDRYDAWARALVDTGPRDKGNGVKVFTPSEGKYALASKDQVKKQLDYLQYEGRMDERKQLLDVAERDWQLAAALPKWEYGVRLGDGGTAKHLFVARSTQSGRWTGKGLQPHNFKRTDPDPLLDTRAMVRPHIQHFTSMIGEECLVAADFKQMELRLGMRLADCTKALDALREGRDLYKDLARKALGREPTTDQRNHMKSILLGIMYGQGRGHTIQRVQEEGATSSMAHAMWDSLESGILKNLRGAWDRLMKKLDENQFYVGETHRGAYIPLPESKRLMIWHGFKKDEKTGECSYETWEHGRWTKRRLWGSKAYSHVVSGWASDILAKVLVKCVAEFQTPHWQRRAQPHVIGHVHDEILVVCARHEAEPVMTALGKWMRESCRLCPMDAEIRKGKTWREAK